MKIRRKTDKNSLDVREVEIGSSSYANRWWCERTGEGRWIYYSSDAWEEVPTEAPKAVWIKNKKTGMVLKARPVLAGNSHLQWFTMKMEQGTETFYSSDMWEELPEGGWETIRPIVANDGRMMRIVYRGAGGMGYSIDHTLPEGMRFVQDGDNVRIEGCMV